MSFSDSDSSSHAGEYKTFIHTSRERLLHEMLRASNQGETISSWKVLILDKLTVKIMSHACKMADIFEEGVTLVEDIYKRREARHSSDAIYFIQPTKENVIMLLSDMSGKSPLYKKAFVFFSSPIAKEMVMLIKKDPRVVPRIGALREMNLEYLTIDSQGFVTDDEKALEQLFGDEEDSRTGDACLNVMATRIATVFASLREFPVVRYRAAKSLDMSTMTTLRDLIPTKLAARVWDRITQYKQTTKNFPSTETCDLLILDRSVDQVAPIIHEWTYDAMCHDLLTMDGKKYIHEIPSKTGGPPEKKEVWLEESDPLWVELRHVHIADASERLHEKMTNFVAKNKAVQIQQGSRNGEVSTYDLRKMVQALPQYSEQVDRLSLHVEIAGKINRIIRESELRELGQLEQDLVFGDATTKDVIKYLTTKENASRENKLRLLMILASIYPEKFEGEKGVNLMKLAKLPNEDMTAVNNMRLLGPAPDSKKNSPGTFTLKFDIHKKKRGVRKDRLAEETVWQLARFYPVIEELAEKLSKGELSKDEYPSMNDPSPTFHGTSSSSSNHGTPPHSMRSRRTPTWARPRNSDDGYSSDSIVRHGSTDLRKMGRRLFIFIVGGVTRSELRVCHKLTSKLQREIILGSSSIDDPPQFITKVKLLTAQSDLSLDNLEI